MPKLLAWRQDTHRLQSFAIPAELGYAEITAGGMTSTNTTVGTDITGLSITFTARKLPVIVEGKAILQTNTANRMMQLFLADSANNILDLGVEACDSTNQYGTCYVFKRLTTLTPGTSYTFKLRHGPSASAQSTVLADPKWPAYIRAREFVQG